MAKSKAKSSSDPAAAIKLFNDDHPELAIHKRSQRDVTRFLAGGRALIPKKPLGGLPFAAFKGWVFLCPFSNYEFLISSFYFQAGL
jgi:hypothetical protein